MPGSFPAAPPSLSGTDLLISQFLATPAAIARRLRTFRDLRFISDQLLQGRMRSSGGAVLFQTGEALVTDRTPESVGPGSTYPYAHIPMPTSGIASVQKWGQKTLLTDEEIARNAIPGDEIDRRLRKVVNAIISTVDALAMSAISSAVTQTFSVTASSGIAWNLANALFVRDILRAKAVITGTNQGYVPDTLALNDLAYAYLMSDEKFTNAISRETTTNPVYTGELDRIGGLAIITSPAVPAGTAYVLDATQLGGMADELDGSPGYAISDLAVGVKAIRRDGEDAYDLQGRRKTVPVILEPAAAVKITNTGL